MNFGSIVAPFSAGIAFASALVFEVIPKIIFKSYNRHKKQYDKDLQTVKFFDNLYRKSLPVNLIDKKGYESLCNVFIKFIYEKENECFIRRK